MRSNWVLATWWAALREVWSQQKAFWLDVSLMILNDSMWLVIYAVYFSQARTINGWVLDDMFMFFAVVTSIFGVMAGLFANLRKLGYLVAEGEIDVALTIPVDTLTYLSVRRVYAPNVGDLIFGVGLFIIAGSPSLERIAIFVAAVLLGSVVWGSFLVIVGSSALFFGGRGDQSQLGFDAIAIFSMYPIDFFGGVTKVLLYTVIPVAFITSMPAEILREFSWTRVGVLAAIAASFFAVARATFSAGLRRYQSGSQWTRA